MQRAHPPSHFPVSLFATPGDVHREIFYTVWRAGHLVGGPEHHILREHFPGHELILCLRGQGWVRVGGRRYAVAPGQLAWINCHHPHEHGANPDAPWEVYWIRIEGPKLARISEVLQVASAPVFGNLDHDLAAAVYRELFRLISTETPETHALIHAQVARLIASLFSARQSPASVQPALPPALQRVVEHMKRTFFERHRLEDLAAFAGMSESHFSRTFRGAFGTSPIDWLRRERISQAKRRLVETSDPVKLIAEQVGYGDRFFFSKDFKQLTGMTPVQFRESEGPLKG